MKASTATVNRISRIQGAIEKWLELQKTYGEVDKIRAAEKWAGQAISERNPFKARIELNMGWTIHHHHKALSALLSGRTDEGIHTLTAVVWNRYLNALWRHNGFHNGSFETYSDCLGIGYFLTAYLFNQQPIVEGAVQLYLAREDGDDLDDFLSGDLDNRDELVGSKWDLLYFLKALDHDISPLVHDEDYIQEALGDYAEFISPDKSRIREVLYELCDAHIYACSTKNREVTTWGLFPVKLLAYMKMAGLSMADYADVHPLLALPTCQLDFSRNYELTNPLIRDLRSLVEEQYPNGLMPVEVGRP